MVTAYLNLSRPNATCFIVNIDCELSPACALNIVVETSHVHLDSLLYNCHQHLEVCDCGIHVVSQGKSQTSVCVYSKDI